MDFHVFNEFMSKNKKHELVIGDKDGFGRKVTEAEVLGVKNNECYLGYNIVTQHVYMKYGQNKIAYCEIVIKREKNPFHYGVHIPVKEGQKILILPPNKRKGFYYAEIVNNMQFENNTDDGTIPGLNCKEFWL